MNIDAPTFRRIAQPTLLDNSLSPDEAAAIVQLAFLAFEADLQEDTDERMVFEQLGRHVCALAGIVFEHVPPPLPLPLPIDDEARVASLRTICARVSTPGARELAYVIVYLIAIVDLELAPVESLFLSELQQLLGIDDARASELVAQASAQVTPMSADDERRSARATRRG